jgi:hypothetical protein
MRQQHRIINLCDRLSNENSFFSPDDTRAAIAAGVVCEVLERSVSALRAINDARTHHGQLRRDAPAHAFEWTERQR